MKRLYLLFPIYLAYGIFTPALYLIMASRGAAQFGLLIALISFGAMAASYITGRLVDRHNVLAGTSLLQAVVMLLYLVSTGWGVYVLQVVYGGLVAAVTVIQQSLIAKHIPHAPSIGSYNAILQFVMATSTIAGGLLIAWLGSYNTVLIAATVLGSTGLLATAKPFRQ